MHSKIKITIISIIKIVILVVKGKVVSFTNMCLGKGDSFYDKLISVSSFKHVDMNNRYSLITRNKSL